MAIRLVSLALILLLCGCSQQQLSPAVKRTSDVAPERPYAQACLIGTIDCMDLDERPFQLCMLGQADRCPQEGQFERVNPWPTR